MEPIRNLRITFWGTRGSCPYFPAPWEIEEFTRRVAVETVSAALAKLADEVDGGADSAATLARLRADPEAFQQRLGLPQMPVYGGETTCVEVETAEGQVLIFDGGSGIRHCASALLERWGERRDRDLYFFGSHEHLDHRSGLPFSSICFSKPPFHFRVYGTEAFLKALDERFGLFSRQLNENTYRDDPLDYTMMTASFSATEIRDLAGHPAPAAPWPVIDLAHPIEIGSCVVSAFPTYHATTPCLGYKVAFRDKSFVFCTDHEVRHADGSADGEESRRRNEHSRRTEENLIRLCRGVDVAYFDGQYYLDEYLGKRGIGNTPPVSRRDWGHGCIEDVLERVERSGVKRAYIGHHDPSRGWPEQIEIDEKLAALSAGKPFHVELSKDCQVIDL